MPLQLHTESLKNKSQKEALSSFIMYISVYIYTLKATFKILHFML